jgi:hypothetical protein
MKNDQKRFERALIVLLVFVAAMVRLFLISSSRFTGDEALFYQAAVQIHDGTFFPQLGPAVTGGAARHPGPLFYYLMSISQFFSRSPEAANAEVAILGAFSVGFVWAAVRSMLGFFPAFIAALLMAFSPWSILYSDRIWNANVIIFLVSVAFWAAVKVYQTPQSRWIALLIAVSAVMPQFHLSVPVVWLSLLVMIAPKWKQWNWKWAVLGVLIGVVGYIPYLEYEFQSGFANLRALQAENIHYSGDIQSYEAVLYAFRFFTLDTTYHELMGYWGGLSDASSIHALFYGSPIRPFNIFRLFALLSSLVLAGLIYFYAFRERKYLSIFWRAFLVGMVADIALMTLTRKPFYPHYLTPMLPFFFALIAGLAHRMQTNVRLRQCCIVLISIFCVGGLEASVSVSRNLDLRNGLATQREVIDLVLSDAQRENWPPGTQIGLRLGFPGYIDGYPVLLQESYRSSYRISSAARGVSPTAATPAYYLVQLPDGESDSRGRKIGDDGLVLFRLK